MSEILSPKKIKELCKQYGFLPSKSYGQNYLITDAPVKKMIEAAEVGEQDTIIEIGPGFGVLTFALAEKAKKVIAYEIEKKLKPYWEENKPDNVEIVWGNALKEIPNSKFQIPNSSYKVVANLPYQITSRVLRTLLELPNPPKSITVMVQKEVADRICGQPGDMSILAVSVQYFGEPKIVAKVPKGCFWPSPKVDSAVIHIGRIGRVSKLSRVSTEEFFKFVRAGFANKRKQLWRNLSSDKVLKLEPEKVKIALQKIMGDERVRAENLSVENWKNLIEILVK